MSDKQPGVESGAATLQVLVVDDEPGMRAGVVRALERHRLGLPDLQIEVAFATGEAGSAEQALEEMRIRPPDILLLDHKLPGRSGMDLLERLRQEQADLLVVMITAYATLDMAVRATKKGAYDLLAKPFTPEELWAAVDKAARHLLLQRQARHLAAERRKVRFEFLSVLAHELKSPLAAVQSYLCVLQEWGGCEQPAEHRRIVDRSLLRIDGMRKLILDLLDLTRIESGQKARRIENIQLDRMAADALDAVRLEAERRDIRVILHAEGGPEMQADRGEIGMVFNNLVSNAIKYNRNGGRVDVRIGRDGGMIRIDVEDTGIGMAPDESERLFGEFVRIRNRETEHVLGSGLGLSIVKKIADLYRGGVEVSSIPGKGSRFTVRLAQDSRREEAAASQAAG